MPKPRSGKQPTQAGALVWVGRVSVRKNVRGSFQPETSSRSITLSNDSESAEHTRAGVVGAPESPRPRRAVDGCAAGVPPRPYHSAVAGLAPGYQLHG